MASFRFALCTLLCYCLFVISPVEAQVQEITPPPPGRDPVEANGILYNIIYVPERCKEPRILSRADLTGGLRVKGRMVIMQKYGPYTVQGNIEIEPSGCLVIMPGTEMYFWPGYGIITNGTLIARGSEKPNQRITMTKSAEASKELGQSESWPLDARLVDGNTTQDGRLDLMYRGKWRGVCTNYNNFTAVDLNVTCRHLGFVYGNFTYHSFARNETDYMLYEKPACLGSENSLFDCPGSANIKFGAHICDGQQVIGFECAGLRRGLAKDHWRGLEFYNSTTGMMLDGNLYYKETLSFLEYLDISYAGLDIYRGDEMFHPRATISASPYVPIMNNITISYGAYDGLNLTEIRGNIHIANSTIHNNRGYGAFIRTAVGRTLINMTDIVDNWGDGLKMYMVNYTINKFTRDYPAAESFCRTPSVRFPSYPIILHEDIIDPEGNGPLGGSCMKRFSTTQGGEDGKRKMVTLHVLIMERDPMASGTITVRDGSSTGPKVLEFPINNGSFPGSVTSKTSELWVNFRYSLPGLQPGQDPRKRCKHMESCIRFLMEVTTNEGPDIELRLYNASVSNNTGYGVNVQDMRSKVSINSSVISDNGYGAGLRVYQGAGEVAVNNTRIEHNVQSGVNITYSGGYQLFNRTTVSDNLGYGVITEYLRLNRTRFELMQKIEVVHSQFTLNQWTAFRIGNYCLGGEYLFNQSYFGYNMHETIEYLSCNISTTRNTNFSMAFNIFENNKRHAVLMTPLVNTVGIFTNNTFRDHGLGVLRLNNGYDFIENRWYSKFDVDYRIFGNVFTNNSGHYCVNFRLTQNSPLQSLLFKFNEVVDNNIQDAYTCLNPRSKARAVIVASSGNVAVQRNHISNPNSVRDIATHLIDPSVTIAADTNWWESTDHAFVYTRLFDQDDRYNLAEFSYHPVLKDNWLYGNFTTADEPLYRWQFGRGPRIGGVLDGTFTTDPRIQTYYVDKDIFILKDSTLVILPGTTLEFESSIGMVIHGRLEADGEKNGIQPPRPITFRLKEEDCLPLINRTAYEKIRLVNGIDEFEGRLELNISGEWGTVCNGGWTTLNSQLVCQQLGLTFNPEYGEPRQKQNGSPDQKIWLNRVECGQLDTEITDCHAEHYGEFQCDHTQDVFIRCQTPTWSGVTIPASPRFGLTFETKIRHLVIDRAGLLDFADMAYTPGLRIDYNFFAISYLTVSNCVSDGINIMYGHPYSRNLIEHVTLENNHGNGILTRSPFLKLSHLFANNNDKAGMIYDPFFTEYQALSVRNFIYRDRTTSIIQNPQITMGDDSMIFLTCPLSEGPESKTYFVELFTTSPHFRITIQVLDYNPLTSVEKVTVYDSRRDDISTARKWEIEEDLVDFPVVSTVGYLTIKYHVNGVRSGRLALAVISKGYSDSVIHSSIHVYNATIQYNERGVVTKHYNNPSNERMEIFHRAKEEEILFDSILIRHNRKEAMFVPSLTKYHENFIPTFEEMTRRAKVGAITYVIKFANISNNGGGIHAEHNHVDFANNVWKWNVTYAKIQKCGSGGFQVELPRVNDMLERQIHSVSINNSEMFDNNDFAFAVNGYYADVAIYLNRFYNNRCNRGLITLSGMEKQLYFVSNSMTNNYAKYVIDLDLKSHSEYSEDVQGLFQENALQNNRHQPYSRSAATTNTPVTYGMAIRGVQKIQVHKNIFHNPDLEYELVAGITALSLDNKLDVKENYWGSTDQYEIRKRIFDFDDWNNFAIADYFPYLTLPDINSDPTTDNEINIDLDLMKLGGRIWQDLTLPLKSTPYVVYSDLTVMPDVTFTIQAGTQLEFYPNIGILVLGKLIASGVPYSRISMRPVQPFQPNFQPPTSNSLTVSNIRFKGGLSENEGFLELFNSSSNSWNLMCDSQFNEKTAEVVCRSMGYETVNVKVRFSYLYDYYVYGKPMFFIKEFWAYSYYCRGDEDNLDMCMKRINYNIKPCIFAANYTFIRCGPRNLQPPMDYWGNIRFSSAKYEEEIVPYIRDDDRSRLEYVDIYGTGFLHGEKVGAIQTTYVFPIMNHVNVTHSVSNGLDVVAPRHSVDIIQANFSQNLGYAVNVLVLNGDSTESEESSFIPLITNTVPYNLYGLVEICRMEKEIMLENRMILFYKYSQAAVDCVKIVRVPSKTLALRFLQFNLYHDDFYRNSVEVFDGKYITEDNMLAELVANSSQSEIRHRYVSTGDTLTIHMHASPSYGSYGFVAEVVTIPLSGLTYPDRKYSHNIKHTVLSNNQDGALLYKNVGEVNPSLMLDHCWIQSNGIGILNLTSLPTIDIGLQSSLLFNLEHSFISRNKGGMYVSATTPSVATMLRSNITNNVFVFGSHGEVLNFTGHHFERFRLYENYIYNNTAGDYRDIIHVHNVVVNFTFNTITNNTGHYIVRAFNTEKTEATQLYQKNFFIGNNATALYRATINVASGNPKINENYLVNTECDFELETSPLAKFANGSTVPHTPIDATGNWWGSESTGYVNGKIWDSKDNASLVGVNFMPIKITNGSLIYGKCAPGWILDGDRCYKYMGAALPYQEADDFCRENGGFLAESKGRLKFLQYLIRLSSNLYNPNMRVWVYSDVAGSRCSAFEKDYIVAEYDCFYTMHPFVCEKDPYITPPDAAVYTLVIAIVCGVFGFATIVIAILLIMWCIKSKRRSKQRFERQSSMRSSVRGSMKTRSTMSMLTENSRHHLVNDNYSESHFSSNGFENGSVSASMVSLQGVTEDETSTDRQMQEKRRQLRQRAEIAKGRSEKSESPRYDTRSEPPRQLGRRQRASLQRDKTKGSNDALTTEAYGKTEETRPEPQKPVQKLPQVNPVPDLQEHLNLGYSDDGFSENEFDPYTDEDDDDVKGRSEDEKEAANQFSPAKYQPRLEKELDSMQMQSLNGSSMNHGRDVDSPSIDVTNRSQNHTFSSPAKLNQDGGYHIPSGERAPTPPPPLPLNIPTKLGSPAKPVPGPRPVPAPRPRLSVVSKSSTTSYPDQKISNLDDQRSPSVHGSRERLDEMKQSAMRASRERLDEIRAAGGMYGSRDRIDAPSSDRYNTQYNPYRDDMYEPYQVNSSHDNLVYNRGNHGDVSVGSGVDYLPRSSTNTPSKFTYGYNSDSEPNATQIPHSDVYESNVNSSRERLWSNQKYNMDNHTAPTQALDDNTGVDYLPRSSGTPRNRQFSDDRYNYNSPANDYRPSSRYNSYQPSPSQNTNPAYNDYNDYSATQPVETNIDSPPVRYPESSGYNYRPSVTNLDDVVYENPSQDPVYQNSPTNDVGSSYFAHNMQQPYNLPSSRTVSRSRDNLHGNHSYSPGIRDDMSNNSLDFEKPRFHKSIETEI